MRTAIYIDGFNFFYLAVKNTPYKWLDFKEVFTKLLHAENKIISIKYFTAIVDGKRDPHKPIRQETYIRALKKHIPEYRPPIVSTIGARLRLFAVAFVLYIRCELLYI